jgi:5-methylcytosine-specific restriction endonuclease McrA
VSHSWGCICPAGRGITTTVRPVGNWSIVASEVDINPYDRAWRAVRPIILARDEHWCQIQGAGCTGIATEVDHINPLATGGARLDPTNLRAACRHCNAGAGARLVNRRRASGYDWP